MSITNKKKRADVGEETAEIPNLVQQAILSWYSINKRDLPWRKTTDPYHILVSEIMLQQTQVPRVIEKYIAWLQEFPTAGALARAPSARVLTLWSGLGYNSRALRLQKSAQAIVARNEVFPTEPEELEELPGIGPYTARAVLAFAFNRDVPVIDTNIRRIFSRLFFKGKGTTETIDAQVRLLIPHGKCRDWNNALMDLGSGICIAGTPLCSKCPVRELCSAHKAGVPELFFKPQPPQKKFEGSNRQSRGYILKLLIAAPRNTMEIKDIFKNTKLKKEILESALAQLVKEKMILKTETTIELPSS